MDRGEPSSAAMSRIRRGADVVRVVSGVVTAIALGAVIVSSIVLLRRFSPDAQAAWGSTVDGGQHYTPRAWVSLHEVAMDVAGVSVLIWFATTLVLVRARTRGANLVVDVAAAIAVIGTWVAAASWGFVRWKQLGLWAVTVGSRHVGLWRATNSDQVRFVFTSRGEYSPHAYLVALLIHLAAPVVATLALCVAAYTARRRVGPPAEPPSDAFIGEVIRG
jgi:hypothetical protein